MVHNSRLTNCFHYFGFICSGIPFVSGLIALHGWIFNFPLLASIRPCYIPMAPNTAIAFVMLGSMLVAITCWYTHPVIKVLTCLVSIIIILAAILSLIQYFFNINLGIDSLNFGKRKFLGLSPIGVMSPLTAGNFFVSAISLLLSLFINKRYSKSIAAVLAITVIVIGLLVILGYMYRTPLLYGGPTVPMALMTAIAFVSVSSWLCLCIGQEYWPLRTVVGTSTNARLMRAFLPITICIILFEGWIYTLIFCKPKSNPALISTFLAILLTAIGGILISRIAHFIANTLDSANLKYKLSEIERFKLLAAVEQNPCSIIITDTTGNIEYVNPKFTELTGYIPQEAIGENPRILKSGERLCTEYNLLWETIISGKEWRGEFHNKKKNGEFYWEYASISPIRNQEGVITHFVAVKEDITERKKYQERIAYLADHDPLTHLLNRRRFREELENQLAYAKRYNTHGALLFMDIDNFKYINDTLGHQVGDKLLVDLADLLQKRLRETDVIARLGGDEFAILLSQVDINYAETIAKEINVSVRQHTAKIDGRVTVATASIGIALFPYHGNTADELLTYADLAMYQAKEEGRNRFCTYALSQKKKIESEMGLEKYIRKALNENRFVLHLQPIIEVRHNSVIGYEALLRMIKENEEIVYPSNFLGAAERFGLIGGIDRWVTLTAIKLLAEVQRAGKNHCISVNLSGKSLTDPSLLCLIKQELKNQVVNPESLILEITETVAITNIFQAEHFINNLKDIGCRFALDDFGVGFSSFNYLKHLPVDYLKIDGSFIYNLLNDASDQHLVMAMAEVAHSLGKQTIAECVGCKDTAQLLSEYGVEYLQGNYIGKPKPYTVAEM